MTEPHSQSSPSLSENADPAAADPMPPAGRWAAIYHFVVFRILRANDHPHRLALGVGLGIFIGFTPTVGFQTAIYLAAAWLLGANKVVGLPVVWISNPATFVPIYYSCYLLGCQLTRYESVNRKWFAELVPEADDSLRDKLAFLGNKFADVAVPLWIGCLLVGVALGTAAYFLTFTAIKRYRLRRHRETT